jgi:hypothetical protein
MNHRPKCKTGKLLENNIGRNLDDLGFVNDSLNTTPKAQPMKEVIDKMRDNKKRSHS